MESIKIIKAGKRKNQLAFCNAAPAFLKSIFSDTYHRHPMVTIVLIIRIRNFLVERFVFTLFFVAANVGGSWLI